MGCPHGQTQSSDDKVWNRWDMDSWLWVRRIASDNIPLMSTVLILWHCIFCTSCGTVLVTTTCHSFINMHNLLPLCYHHCYHHLKAIWNRFSQNWWKVVSTCLLQYKHVWVINFDKLRRKMLKNRIYWSFWATVSKTVRPMLLVHCPVCLSVCLWHWCIVAKWFNGSR